MKILIVDNAAPFRVLMRSCLTGLPDVQVIGVAADGERALEMVERMQPDLITLDMDMPKMSGLEVLARMKVDYPDIKVIVVSCGTETDAAKTMKALAQGAFDFIVKPDSKEADPKTYLQDKLIPKIKQARSMQAVAKVSKPRTVATRISTPTPPQLMSQSAASSVSSIKSKASFKPSLVAIGSSTGGPEALKIVLDMLPAEFPVPIVITQHMPKAFVVSLATRLNQSSQLTCSVAEHGEILKAGHVYIAPGDIHMKIIRKGSGLAVNLEVGERVNHAIPSVDVMYESLVALSPTVQTLAVILTGMGNDGAKGAKALADKQNYVLVQDESSSVVWGMAGEAFRMGASDEVLPLSSIADALLSQTN